MLEELAWNTIEDSRLWNTGNTVVHTIADVAHVQSKDRIVVGVKIAGLQEGGRRNKVIKFLKTFLIIQT